MSSTFASSLADYLDGTAERLEWASDGPAWVRGRLGEYLWSKQVEIMDAVRDHRLVAVAACHGPGKSRVVSRTICWWIDTHPVGTARVVTTAPTMDQVKGVVWAELHDAADKLRQAGTPLPGKLSATEWKIGAREVAIGRSPSDHNPHGFQGRHARYNLIVLDEACGVAKVHWTGATALATGEENRILAVGNPDDPGSEFARVCLKPDSGWHVIWISAFDTPNFTDEYVPADVAATLTTQAYVDSIVRDFGIDSPTYTSKVLGRFPLEQSDGVVRLTTIIACGAGEAPPRTVSELLPVEIGLDPAASTGGDDTVMVERRGATVGRVVRCQTQNTMEVAGRALEFIRLTGATAIKVDNIGVGAGVCDRLQELADEGAHPARVVPVDVRKQSSQPERFPNLRSEIWWQVARRLSEDHGWDFRAVPEGWTAQEWELQFERFKTQLTAPTYKPDSSGRLQVELKEDTKKRLGRSPDDADALNLAFYTPAAATSAMEAWFDAALAPPGRR